MGSFACVGNFGLSLEHQEICLDTVPKAFEGAIKSNFERNEMQSSLEELRVEMSSIQSASIQYFLYVRFQSGAAEHYWKIQRMMQQACVATCNREGWKIENPDSTFQIPPTSVPQK